MFGKGRSLPTQPQPRGRSACCNGGSPMPPNSQNNNISNNNNTSGASNTTTLNGSARQRSLPRSNASSRAGSVSSNNGGSRANSLSRSNNTSSRPMQQQQQQQQQRSNASAARSQPQQQQQAQRRNLLVPLRADGEELDSNSCRQTPYPMYLKGAGAVAAEELVSETFSEDEFAAKQQQQQQHRGHDANNNDRNLDCSPSFENSGVCGLDALSPVFQGRGAAIPLQHKQQQQQQQNVVPAARSQPAEALQLPAKPRSHSGRPEEEQQQLDENDDNEQGRDGSLQLDDDDDDDGSYEDENNSKTRFMQPQQAQAQSPQKQAAQLQRELERVRGLEQQRRQLEEMRMELNAGNNNNTGGNGSSSSQHPPLGSMSRKIDTTSATSAPANKKPAHEFQLVTQRSRQVTPSPMPDTSNPIAARHADNSAILGVRPEKQQQQQQQAAAIPREAAVSRAVSTNNGSKYSNRSQQPFPTTSSTRNASASVSTLRADNNGSNNNMRSNATTAAFSSVNQLPPQQHFSGEFDEEEEDVDVALNDDEDDDERRNGGGSASLEEDADMMVAITEAKYCGGELHAMVDNLVKRQTRYLKRMGRRNLAQKRRYDQALLDAEQGYERSRVELAHSAEKRVESLDGVCAQLRDELAQRAAQLARLEADKAAMATTLHATTEQLRDAQRALLQREKDVAEAREAQDAAEKIATELHEQLIAEQDRYRQLQRQHIAAATAAARTQISIADAAQHNMSNTSGNNSGSGSVVAASRPALTNVSNANLQSVLHVSALTQQSSSSVGVNSSHVADCSNNTVTNNNSGSNNAAATLLVQPYQPKVFVLSGFTGAERDRIAGSIKSLGGSVVSCAPDAPLPPKVTHVVIGSHTPKAVAGMLADDGRVWTVPAAFVHSSFKSGTWAHEGACGGIASDGSRWRRAFPIVIVPRRAERDPGAEEVCRLLAAHGFTLVEESAAVPEATARSKSLAALYQQMRPGFLDAQQH